MKILRSMAEKLELAGVGTRGEVVFINMMPADKAGVLLRDPFGGMRLDHELPGMRQTSFQLVTRGKTMAIAEAKMDAALAALVTEIEQDYPQGMHVKYIRQRHDPLSFPVTIGDQKELLVNIDACVVLV